MTEQTSKSSIIKNRNFMLFFSGNVISQIGSVFIQFATSLFILDLTGKALYMSIYMAISYGVYIFLQPILGALSDRFDKAKLISNLDFLFGSVELLFVLLLFLVRDKQVILIALFINGTITSVIAAFYQPAASSMTPLVAKDEELTQAYSWMSILGNGQQIAGILLASLLYMVLGFKWLLLIDAITYIVAAIMERFIKIEKKIEPTKEKSHLWSDLKDGFRYMNEKKELINMAKVAVIMNIFLTGIFGITLPYMINTDLQIAPYILGAVNAIFSAGGLLMAMIISKKEITNIGSKLSGGFSISVFCFAGMLLSYLLIKQSIIGVLAFAIILGVDFFIHGAAGSYIQIPLNISYAKRVEEAYMGRVMALRYSLSSIATPVAMIGFGLILDHGGVAVALAVGTIGTLGATLFTKVNPYIKRL